MGLLDLYRDYFRKLHSNLNAEVGGISGPQPQPAFLRRMLRHGGRDDHLPDALFHQPALPDEFPTGRLDSRALGPPRRRRGRTDAATRKRSTGGRATCKNRPRSCRKKRSAPASAPDMKPVPAPTVRDLSVPQPSKSGRAKKAGPARAGHGACAGGEVEVIPAHEVAAATTGGHSGQEGGVRRQTAEAKPAEAKAEARLLRRPTPGTSRPSPSPNRRCTLPVFPLSPPQAQAAPETQAHYRRLPRP